MPSQTITLTTGERTLLRESIDENLSQINNKLCPELANSCMITYRALERHRDRLVELKKRIKR